MTLSSELSARSHPVMPQNIAIACMQVLYHYGGK